ncbi:MAG: response regulator [Gammaproteobacteria bacterium]|nr:response regulator [Gammaproteobacteria bacterium]
MNSFPASLFAEHLGSSPFATIVATVEDGTILYANDAAAAMGAEAGIDDLVGLTTVEIQFWVSEEERLADLAEARKPGGKLHRFDYISPGGQRRAELQNSRIIVVEGNEYLTTTVVSIFEVIEVEQQLEEAFRRLEKAQAIGRMGDFIIDMETWQFDGSAECLRLLDAVGSDMPITMDEMYELFHADDRDMVREMTAAGIESSGQFALEHRLHRNDGAESWVFARAEQDETEDGRSIIRGSVVDITERKVAERERDALNRKMLETQRLESLGLLAGGVAHDFNNLLAGILGNADFALLDQNLPADTKRRLQDIVTASKRASELTRQLLAYSGKGRFVVEGADVTKLVREMADLLKVTISGTQVLRFFLAENLPPVEADVTQLRQVVMNVIINASEAIDHEQGLINIATGVQDCSTEYLAVSGLAGELTPGEYVFVEVSDNGVGMDQETVERIFDPFFTTKFTGRGLGMAAVQGIVRGHQGALKIYSEPGRGTTFKMFLPASTEVSLPVARAAAPTERWEGTGGVLVIDDELTVRNFVQSVLERFGYQVYAASSGEEGVDLLVRHSEDIGMVFLDLTMPGMGGVETLARLREVQGGIPTVLMSGFNEQDATQEFVGGGLAAFLAKPFVVEELMELVARTFAR